MSKASQFASLFQAVQSALDSMLKTRPRHRTSYGRATLEGLEQRRLMSTYNVTTTDDTNASGTLRWAVGQVNANGGGTIDCGDISGQTVTLSLGQLTITTASSVEIDASGITVSGNSVSRVLQINAGANVTINSIRITDANVTGNGGGISNSGTLDLESSSFDSDHASVDGGAGLQRRRSALTINSDQFTNNSAAQGGGIYSTGSTLSLSNSYFDTNSATNGGAVVNSSNSSPTIQSCQFYNNTAATSGGAVYDISSSPSLTNCYFYNNSASQGGAIFSSSGTTHLDSCYLYNNSATAGTIKQGGGIYLIGAGLTATNTTISQNTAALGGGIYSVNTTAISLSNNTHVDNNTATSNGGGIVGYGGSLSLANSTVNQNTAGGSAGGICRQPTLPPSQPPSTAIPLAPTAERFTRPPARSK